MACHCGVFFLIILAWKIALILPKTRVWDRFTSVIPNIRRPNEPVPRFLLLKEVPVAVAARDPEMATLGQAAAAAAAATTTTQDPEMVTLDRELVVVQYH